MSDFSEQIVAFFDGSNIKFAYVNQHAKDKLNLTTETGKSFKLPAKNALVSFGDCSSAASESRMASLANEMQSAMAEIDTTFLWEVVSEEEVRKEWTIIDLCELNFGEAEAMQQATLFEAVAQDTIRFKRKGQGFSLRSAKQVEEQLLMLQKKQEKEEYLGKLTPWIDEQLKAGKDAKIEIPEEFNSFFNHLESYLFNQKANESSKILADFCNETNLKNVAFDFLYRSGRLPADCDPFLVKAGIEERFSQRTQEAAESVDDYQTTDEERRDFSELYSFSIDDEETRDIDDALSLEEKPDGGYTVSIHVADVTAYVKKGDVLDGEGIRRVTSVYLPSRTVNMFPARLSQDLASLVEGELRPAMTFVADFDADLNLGDWSVCKSEVKIDRKLSYNYCDSVLENPLEDEELSWRLKILGEVADKLKDVRLENGAVVFARPELKIRVKDDEVTVEEQRTSSKSRFLVSEYMILANSIAARFCARNDIPIIYRTQELGEGLPEDLDENHYDPIVFDKAIRCMKKSRLSLHPDSHGGLGVDFYTQLTSPIRRYADLVIQRQLSAYLGGKELPYEANELLEIMSSADAVNMEVRDVQRSAESYWLHEFIRRTYVGEELGAIVTGSVSNAMLAELDEVFVRVRIVGSGDLSVGERINVRINKVNAERGWIDVQLVKHLDE